jgi:pimeloyl-ACP methyl ester carboxylesterase
MESKLDKATINYKVYGDGKPVLMLHGYQIDSRSLIGCMEPIFEKRKGFKRFYLDLPGMGKTKAGNIRNSDDILETLIQFINAVFSNQRFLVVGNSYGGYLARGIIFRKSNLIDGMLLICPLIIPERKKRDLPVHKPLVVDDELVNQLNPADAAEFTPVAVIQKKYVWERFRDEILPGVRVADEEFLAKLWNEGYPFSFEVDKEYEKFEKPTLILMGRKDASVGYRDVWKIIEKFPRASLAVLDEAGHLLQIEKEKLFNYLVNEWLDRIIGV